MSHISNFEADNAKERMIATPAPEQMGKTVRDFFSRKDCLATPRRFAGIGQSINTPARQLTFAPDIIAGVEEDDFGEKAAKDLTGRVWKAFKVSPLFRYNENGIENMVSELQSHLQGYIDKVDGIDLIRNFNVEDNLESYSQTNEQDNVRQAVLTNKDKQWFWVSVNVVKGLRGHRDDTEALQFQIKQNLKGVKGGNREKICSTCYLLSVDAQEASFISKNVAQLPLCLTCGDAVLNKHLFQGLIHRFDCTIFPLEIPEEELMWMSALWSRIPPVPSAEKNNEPVTNHKTRARKRKISENTSPNSDDIATADNIPITEDEISSIKGDEVKLRFTMAEGKEVPGVDHIDVTFEGAQIRKLWQNFHKKGTQDTEITQEEMESFHTALRSHACNTIQLCLDDRNIFKLSQVWLPIFSVSNKGQIRIEKDSSKKTVKSTLRELTNLCQGSTLKANPRISATENVDTEIAYE